MTWEWVTGFYEGEGSAWISCSGQPGVSFYQKQKQVLGPIQKFIGFGRIRPKNRPKKKCKIIWSLQFSSNEDVRRVLNFMLPFMQTTRKRRQAESVLRRLVL
jgi:hypothetical protein